MKSSKLVKAISELNAWELRHLSDFVHSPFFNKHERLTQLMDWIIGLAPDFTEEELDRHRIYKMVFQNGPFDQQKFKDLLSLGMKTFKSFLTFYRLRQDESAQGFALLEELTARKWEGEFGKTRAALEKLADTQPGQVQEKELRHLRLQEALISFQGAHQNRKVDDIIHVASDHLDAYYLVARLKYAVEMANRRNVVGQEFELGLLGPMLEFLVQHPEHVERHRGVRIYLLIYQLLTQPDATESFDALNTILSAGITEYHIAERREIYGYALNYCIQQINRGKSDFLGILLGLYEQALEDQTLLNEGWLSQWDYKNIVSAGLKAGRYDWCEHFIEAYKEKVEPTARENAYTYNLASLYYEQGKYSLALKLLQHVEFSDVFYHLGSKVILLKSYYELADTEALMHLCETFRMYLKRNTDLSKYHQTTNMNLIALTRKLADLQSRWPDLGKKEREAQIAKLRAAMEEKGNVAQKGWLTTKLFELRIEN